MGEYDPILNFGVVEPLFDPGDQSFLDVGFVMERRYTGSQLRLAYGLTRIETKNRAGADDHARPGFVPALVEVEDRRRQVEEIR